MEKFVIEHVIGENERGKRPTQSKISFASCNKFIEGISTSTLKKMMPRLKDKYGIVNPDRRGYYHPDFYEPPQNTVEP